MIAKLWAWLLSLFGKTPATPAGWNIQYSPGMPPQMTELLDGTFCFAFPFVDGVHYVVKAASPVALGQTITLRFAIMGDGKLIPTQGDPPAKLRLFLQQAGDTMTAAEADKRWWSAPIDLVGPNEYGLTVKLTPDQWTNIFGVPGSTNLAGFAGCIADIGNIGVTFGGTFAGHGVFAQGPSRFVLKQFTVS
jgi:hypothetical protein